SAGNPQTLNLFSYALNNPIKYTDPSGHSVCPPLCSDTPSPFWGLITSLLGLSGRVDSSQGGVVNSLVVQMSCGVLGGICKVQNGVLQASSKLDMAQHGIAAVGMTLLDPSIPGGLSSN